MLRRDPNQIRRQWRPLAASAAFIIATLVWFFASRAPRQPIYEGKTLTLWLRTYAPSSPTARHSPEWKKTDHAVRQMGTNGIPVLLQMLRARDSRLKLGLVSLSRKQRLIKIHFIPAGDLNAAASRAFIVLGEAAKDSVPALMKTYQENISTESQTAIVDTLAWIGPAAKPALPLLLGAVTHSDARVRANALWALGELRADPKFCLPKLINGLNDSNPWARVSAAHALGSFGANAAAAIAALSSLTNINFRASGIMGKDLQVSIEAKNALRKICPNVEDFPGIELPMTESWLFRQSLP